jgi:CMP-N-acetylneuraminic acid synthetase
MSVEVLAVIPARGGSKGLPRKNLRTVGGRTLVALAVEAALDSVAVNRVVGSTDDTEIAEAMRDAGAEVPWLRPDHLAGDHVHDEPVFLDALRRLAVDGYRPDIVVNVRPTAPLRTGADITAAVGTLLETPGALSVKSVSEAGEHPYKMWTVAGPRLAPLLPDWHERHDGWVDVPRQALPPIYRSNGAVDAVWTSALLETGRFHPGVIAAYVMPAERAIDVDDESDLRAAEAALLPLARKGNA